MAKRKAPAPDDEFVPVTAGAIRDCIAFHDSERDKADLYADNAKAALEPLRKAHGLKLAAVKSAMKLRKLSPADCKAWLDSFNTTVAALGLDAQLDMLDQLQRLRDDGGTVSAGPVN